MNNFWQRTLFGTVYVGLVIAAFFINKYFFYAVMLTFIVVSLHEYYRLILPKSSTELKAIGFFIGIVCFVTQTIDTEMFAWFALGSFLFSIAAAFILKAPGLTLRSSMLWVGGILYIILPLCLITYYHTSTYYDNLGNPSAVTLLAFILIWTNDTGAYLVGRAFGKHPLAPKISPKKTWEGFIGGAILTIGMAYLAVNQNWFLIKLTPALVLAAIFSVFGPIGDLFESSIKRKAGVKDSGNIIPGHGGLLDRLDGLLMATLASAIIIFIFILSL